MQKKKHSLLEACLSTAIGFGVAVLTNFLVLPLFGLPVTGSQSFWIGVVFTLVSAVRGYYVRRLFNWLHVKGILV